ncbi:D-aminoacyl-tRNA deacylase [Psychrobium sp. 1_MG-2023]|uniref:D-aminoacyl-tRNA deacylase n=1 Tax=Psychrobium sp. 1_MG-2023 TaxID=3062624 RepID=UPI000C31F673|nr:D-aminoacyl-tRNA deacylase [Psychrobium sp. 1_MG-2023]MDP2560385.1 D-aminoacyl-tRNA deacylase [Psychrobium sp. 1_MG-2023]PKF57946.1 D-tyrosyl-tRNA(Tyr) deacylase [Alteromonadales bacterium alter-6D02]
MIALIQRVKQAKVEVNNQVVGEIGQGLLVLLGVEREDTPALADKLVKKVTSYRVFNDDEDKMNLSLNDISGQLLVVSQFTLAADTKKGLRPGFSSAATPALAESLYEHFVERCKVIDIDVHTGQFGADMQVSLTNDGPVTFSLKV